MGHGSACLCTFYRFWLRTFDMRFHLSGREVLDLFGAHAVVEVFSIFEGHRIIIFAVAFSFALGSADETIHVLFAGIADYPVVIITWVHYYLGGTS